MVREERREGEKSRNRERLTSFAFLVLKARHSAHYKI
jgi:hypothetical protein